MSDLVTDPNDPRLTRGGDSQPVDQAKAYLVLSKEERAKGFVRPVRSSYIHVGVGGHEIEPGNPAKHGRIGNACGAETTMSRDLAETYARDPYFMDTRIALVVGCIFQSTNSSGRKTAMWLVRSQ